MIRPQPTCWFEIIVARDDAFAALETLAAAGCVEIEWHVEVESAGVAQRIADLLKAYSSLAHRYRAYWPAPAAHLTAERRAPADVLAAAIERLRDWAAEAEPLIHRWQAAQTMSNELALAEAAVRMLASSDIDFAAIAQASHGVTARVFALPISAELEIPTDALVRDVALTEERLLLVVGPIACIEALDHAVLDANGRQARLPAWLTRSASDNVREIQAHRLEHESAIAAARDELQRVAARHDVTQILGEVARAAWCAEHGGAIERGEVFARITGWTTERLQVIGAIERSTARAIVTFPPPPRGVRPPLVLRNPAWVKPFEMFTRLVGMPSEAGADPSAVLAIAVPLLFGYMFGDVGQGLVLVVAGFVLKRRWPLFKLLIPAGVAAMVFGFVFGSVFSMEHVLHPWWVAPIEHPLPVLLVPLLAGAVLLTLGLLLGALEAYWQSTGGRWLREDAPLLMVYMGIVLGIAHPPAWLLVAAGAAWAVFACARHTRSLAKTLAGVGELAERIVQLLINTLSFARVGAFALAHAGLSSAVMSLANAAENPLVFGLILVLGNVLILAIEGLVVSIQTTRLVLFEFFARFFQAEGREFRPLAPPPVTILER